MLFLLKSTAKSAIILFWFPEGFGRWEKPPMPAPGKTPLDFQQAAFEGALLPGNRERGSHGPRMSDFIHLGGKEELDIEASQFRRILGG